MFETGYRPDDFTSERTIVGVVADVRYRSLRDPEAPAFYIHDYLGTAYVVISTSAADPKPLIPRIRAIVDAVAPGIPITIRSLDEVLQAELARHRLGLVLMSLFAAVSLLLAGIGIHGVVGHGISLRSTEFAVRIAVGARPATIAASVLRGGGILWLTGIGFGVALAYIAGRLGSSRLYEVQASDPAILAAAVTAVSLLTLVAVSLSALKGSRVEPGEVLKSE
jgi:ABC-type antimicrobial peptide transport system permease subunit